MLASLSSLDEYSQPEEDGETATDTHHKRSSSMICCKDAESGIGEDRRVGVWGPLRVVRCTYMKMDGAEGLSL